MAFSEGGKSARCILAVYLLASTFATPPTFVSKQSLGVVGAMYSHAESPTEPCVLSGACARRTQGVELSGPLSTIATLHKRRSRPLAPALCPHAGQGASPCRSCPYVDSLPADTGGWQSQTSRGADQMTQTLPSCRQLDQGESRGRTHRCCARSLRRTLAEACSRVVGLSEGMGSGGARRPAGAWLLDVGPKLHMALGSRKSARCIRASRRGATGDGWERGRSGLACLRTKWQEPAQVWWTAWLAFCRILMIACGPCTAEEC